MTSSAAQAHVMGSNADEQVREFDKYLQAFAQSSPTTEIVVQPKARGLRFRYECEGRNAGSIPGENSTPENRIYPKIRINNTEGSDSIVVVSCVSKDAPHRPHPHALVGRDCKSGVCTVKLKKVSHAAFPNLGIQCAKKKDVVAALTEREKLRVDPFQTGFSFDPSSVDLSVVRLCFQVFLPDANGKFNRIVPPVVSQCIYDKKTVSDLVICRISRHAGSVRGGEDVFLLCDKVHKDDIEVRFFEETDDGVIWEARGDFGQQDVHRQFAIVFRTPPYRDLTITEPKQVYLQLRRPSDDVKSEVRSFTYAPLDPDPYGLEKRRRKRVLDFPEYVNNPAGGEVQEQAAVAPGKAALKDHLMKDRVIAKPRRGKAASTVPMVKEEADLGACALTNPAHLQPQPHMATLTNVPSDGMSFTDLDRQAGLQPDMTEVQMMGWSQPGTMTQFPDTAPDPTTTTSSDNVQHMLSSLANGGNNSLQIDSGSLLQFLEDGAENQGLIHYLQGNDADMS